MIELKKGDRILWDGQNCKLPEIWKVKTLHFLERESDGCEYHSGVTINDIRHNVQHQGYLLTSLKK